ncbi:MAG: glutathione S-transferase N-terminal domain-containing protein [Pseudomonadota bacterium]
MIVYALNLGASFLASVLRLGAGGAGAPVELAEPIIIYEFEGCPFCRIAREAVSQTGVPVLIRPCPKGGTRFRPQVRELGGKSQFPYMIDPNTDQAMYESSDIARYLHEKFGCRRHWLHFTGPLNIMLSQFGVLVRAMSGTFRRSSRPASPPLELFGAERDPQVRLVKERLCEMELEYLWRARGPEGHPTPLLNDINTGETRCGARSILHYLKAAYRE